MADDTTAIIRRSHVAVGTTNDVRVEVMVTVRMTPPVKGNADVMQVERVVDERVADFAEAIHEIRYVKFSDVSAADEVK